MEPQIYILEAMLHCPYKAWQLSKLKKTENPLSNPLVTLAHHIGKESLTNASALTKLQKTSAGAVK